MGKRKQLKIRQQNKYSNKRIVQQSSDKEESSYISSSSNQSKQNKKVIIHKSKSIKKTQKSKLKSQNYQKAMQSESNSSNNEDSHDSISSCDDQNLLIDQSSFLPFERRNYLTNKKSFNQFFDGIKQIRRLLEIIVENRIKDQIQEKNIEQDSQNELSQQQKDRMFDELGTKMYFESNGVKEKIEKEVSEQGQKSEGQKNTGN